jgi:hypothetical protein
MRSSFALALPCAAALALSASACSSSSTKPGTGGSGTGGDTTATSGTAGGTSTSSTTSTGTGGAAGTPTFVVAGYDLRRIVSTDGVTWDHDTSDPPDPDGLDNIGDGIAFGNGLCAVVAHSGLVTTRDGITWTKVGDPLPQKWPGLGGGKVVFDSTKGWVIIAGSDSYLSSDGVAWTKHTSNAGATHWNGFAYGNGHFVAVGDSNSAGGDRKASEDGVAWHDYQEGGPRYAGVAFGNGVFVAVGDGGMIHTTADGASWDDHSDGGYGDLANIVFAKGEFLTCSPASSKCYTSADGAAWTAHDVSFAPGGPLTHGLGVYLSVSWESNIWTSPDGLAWNKVWSGDPGSNAFNAVGFGDLGP